MRKMILEVTFPILGPLLHRLSGWEPRRLQELTKFWSLLYSKYPGNGNYIYILQLEMQVIVDDSEDILQMKISWTVHTPSAIAPINLEACCKVMKTWICASITGLSLRNWTFTIFEPQGVYTISNVGKVRVDDCQPLLFWWRLQRTSWWNISPCDEPWRQYRWHRGMAKCMSSYHFAQCLFKMFITCWYTPSPIPVPKDQIWRSRED